MLDFGAALFAVVILAVVLRALVRRVVKRRAVAWLLAVVVATLVTGFAVFRISRSRTFQLFDHMVVAQPTAERVVALTFDDGPTAAYTPVVLDVLARERVPATFFLIGAAIEDAPDAARRIAAAGHEIGNHSYSHDRMFFKSEGWIANEIERTDDLIRRTGYAGPVLFRSPFGKRFVSLPWYLARHGRLNVFWDLEPDSDPAVARSADAIAREVVTRARPGSIILLHVMYAVRQPARQALPAIIQGLRARGFRFVTVSQLLAMRRR